jgi:5-methylthioadenosine/S-adenosylhomocysteine deaminase
MRATLLSSQLADGPRLHAADVHALATTGGAAALGLADRVGTLAPGRQADLLLLRGTDLNLAGAHDLLGALVTAAHPGNVDTVLVAGTVHKRHGRLLRHDLDAIVAAAADAGARAARG